jgi:CRP/FNR family cyclic AMP-dependent transcriptional regulator
MMAVPDPDLLRKIPLFLNLNGAELARLHSLLHCNTFPAGTNILTMRQPGEAAYIILSGTVKIHIEEDDGSAVILAIVGPGEVLGEMSLVDSLGRSATAVTMEDSCLFWMERAAFWDSLNGIPAMTHNLVRIMSRRLRLANAQIQSLATLDVYGRVARQILAFAQEYGEPVADGAVRIPIRLTHSDLAGLVGASRGRLKQVLGAYKRHQYITVDASYHITVLNPQALALRCLHPELNEPAATADGHVRLAAAPLV